jgi:hypothetical protein
MSRRTNKNGGGHGKPGKHGKKAMRNTIRRVHSQAANMRSVLSMMSGKKFAVSSAAHGKKGHNPFMLASLVSKKPTKMKVVSMASRASTRKSGKSHAFNMLHQQNLEHALKESVKLQAELKKAKKNGNAAKVRELESILAGLGL